MHIIQIASEMAPAAKVGGLGDVVLGLSRELNARGHTCEVIIPKYDCMDIGQVDNLHLHTRELWSYYDGRWHSNAIWKGLIEGIQVYLLEAQNDTYFFERGRYYGCDDDMDRFLYFSRSALEFLMRGDIRPDILHIHDWQTAAIAPLVHDMYREMGLDKVRVVFTIHNIEYQGWTNVETLGRTGLHAPAYLTISRLQDNAHPETINLMKGAICFADQVTTVSPNYAHEVTTPEGGRGMHPTLQAIHHKFTGILNGLDYQYWNPETDHYLDFPFSVTDPSNKAANKSSLQERLKLAPVNAPVISCITRLVPQKGIELIKYALFRTLEQGGQFILLGSSPIDSINQDFHSLKQRFSQNDHVHMELHHNEELAHLIYAGSDLFIVPSIFEPCGLTQLIAMRYGTIPIVRHTGGLADTVFDVDFSEKPKKERNGFVFHHVDCEAVDSALLRALRYWREERPFWRQLVKRAMGADHSWKRSAKAYEELYKNCLSPSVLSDS